MWWRTSALVLALGSPLGAAFEFAGQGAQSTALGGAFAASTQTAEAVWFNPAGNAQQQKWRAGTTHALLYPGLDQSPALNGLSVAGPLRGGGFQLGLSFLGADGWREEVIALGYGRPLHERFALGGGLRTSTWKAGDLAHRAWHLDVGATWEVGFVHPRAYLRLALVAKGLTGANIAAGGQAAGEQQPPVVAAAALNWAGREILLDVERRDGQTEFRVGFETRTVSLNGARFRMGGAAVGTGFDDRELNVGLGHNYKQWHFDYAYSYPLHLSGYGGVHWFSVGYRQR